jgi:hypothetical protein
MIVLHHTVTPTAIDTLNTLNARGLSVNYIADRNGTIYYMVRICILYIRDRFWINMSEY